MAWEILRCLDVFQLTKIPSGQFLTAKSREENTEDRSPNMPKIQSANIPQVKGLKH